MKNRPTRVLTGKIGLDGHDRGIKVVTMALAEAGMDVTYLGMRQGAEQVAAAVAKSEADVLALNFAGADHLTLVPKLMDALRAERLAPGEDLLIVIGGIIPDEDVEKLKSMGVAEVFLPGAPIADIVAYFARNGQLQRSS